MLYKLDSILSKHNIPVDIEKIVAQENIKVDKYCVDLNDDEKGRLNKYKDGYIMQIGAFYHPYQKHFIMAQFLFDVLEKEKYQNQFANQILMPEEVINEILDNFEVFDKKGNINLVIIDLLFRKFKVPKTILAIRLKEVWRKKNNNKNNS